MKIRTLFIIVLILLGLVLTGCATGRIASYDPNSNRGVIKSVAKNEAVSVVRNATYDDGDIIISATYSYRYNTDRSGVFSVIIYNNSNNFLKLNYNDSSYIANGISSKVCDGETRKIDSAKVQPLISIPPESSIIRYICNPESESGKFILNDTFSLYLAIEGEDKTTYCKLEFSPSEQELNLKSEEELRLKKLKIEEESRVEEKLGTVSVSFTKWHIFFTGKTEEAIKERLFKKAIKEYGENTYLKNIKYEANWSPLSLLLYFDYFGYAQKVTASADVYVTYYKDTEL